MAYIETVPDADATGAVERMYDVDREALGARRERPREVRHGPEAYAAWRQLNGAVKSTMDLRRYELATLAAARRLRSTYCALAHGAVLATLMEPEAVRAAAEDHRNAGLDPLDVAVMDFADQVARDATSVTPDDIGRLRAVGLSDPEILDVVLAVAARCFFSTVLDALGAEPDARYAELDPSLREALTVGRPFSGA